MKKKGYNRQVQNKQINKRAWLLKNIYTIGKMSTSNWYNGNMVNTKVTWQESVKAGTQALAQRDKVSFVDAQQDGPHVHRRVAQQRKQTCKNKFYMNVFSDVDPDWLYPDPQKFY